MATNDSLTEDILQVHVSILYLVIVLPLCIFILYLGFEQWKSKRNNLSWFINYSDFFTYNLVLMELVGMVGYAATLCVMFIDHDKSKVLFLMGDFAWYGQMMFPVCLCIEHYIAVVHPMTYLSLKKGKGRLIRNISTGLVWVVTLVLVPIAIIMDYGTAVFFADMCQMIVYLGTIFYCGLAVLKVLIHPKPGGVIRDKGNMEKSKRHAFVVIVLVLVVLGLKFGFNVLISIFWGLMKGDMPHGAVFNLISYWINFLTSLLLPLLYLQRAGKLQQCGRKIWYRNINL